MEQRGFRAIARACDGGRARVRKGGRGRAGAGGVRVGGWALGHSARGGRWRPRRAMADAAVGSVPAAGKDPREVLKQLQLEDGSFDVDLLHLEPGEDYGYASDDGADEEEDIEEEQGLDSVICVDNVPAIPEAKYDKVRASARRAAPLRRGRAARTSRWPPGERERSGRASRALALTRSALRIASARLRCPASPLPPPLARPTAVQCAAQDFLAGGHHPRPGDAEG